MQYNISCDFLLENSYKFVSKNFKAYNNSDLATPIKFINPFGLKETNVEITKIETKKYRINIFTSILFSYDKAVDLLNKIAAYLSFLINKQESNPKHGTLFVELDLFGMRTGGGLSTDTEIYISGDITFQDSELEDVNYIDILNYYYEGLKSNYWKSKFFHWFLILESLEQSIDYKKLFKTDLLYTKEELVKMKSLACSMSDKRKRSSFLSIARITVKNRNQKLVIYLNKLGITNFKVRDKEILVSENLIKTIINERNSSFHTGSLKENILWENLFPLVTKIVTYLYGTNLLLVQKEVGKDEQ